MTPNKDTYRTMCDRQAAYSQSIGIETTPSAFERGLLVAKLGGKQEAQRPTRKNGLIVRIAHFIATLFN